MKIGRYILIVMLMLVAHTSSAEEKRYLFDIKLYDITGVSEGIKVYETLEPFSNPKMIVSQGVAASMKMSGDEERELMFELELTSRGEKVFDIKFEIFKSGTSVTGPVLTENFTSDKSWQMVTNFDGRKLVVAVEMKQVSNNGD